MINFSKKKLFLLDGDGTLKKGGRVIEGAVEFLYKLKKRSVEFTILTNNTSKTAHQHAQSYKELGIDFLEAKHIVTPMESAIRYLRKKNFRRVYAVATSSVLQELESNGLVLTENNPDALLLTYDTELTYDKLARFSYLLNNTDARYFASHIDMVCPSETGDIPDIGTFIELFYKTTHKKPETTFGKPNTEIIDNELAKYKREDIVLVGDRIYTDMRMAESANIDAVLVFSGDATPEDVKVSNVKIPMLTSSVKDLIDLV